MTQSDGGAGSLPEGFWESVNERYRHVTDAMFPDRMPEPAWADLVRPADYMVTPQFGVDVSADGTLDALVVRTPGASGIVSTVQPATEPAEPLTREAFVEAVDRIMADDTIRTQAAPLPLTTHARQNGKTLEACLALIAELERARDTRIVLGPADWARVLDAADEETRELLVDGQRRGVIIVSPYLPEPATAYRIQVSTRPQDWAPPARDILRRRGAWRGMA